MCSTLAAMFYFSTKLVCIKNDKYVQKVRECSICTSSLCLVVHTSALCKIIHPNYSKDWLYLGWSCIKILCHGWNHGLFLPLFKWKYTQNLDFYIVKDFYYLMYMLLCQKPAMFLSVQMAMLSSFLPIFIVHTWDV